MNAQMIADKVKHQNRGGSCVFKHIVYNNIQNMRYCQYHVVLVTWTKMGRKMTNTTQ